MLYNPKLRPQKQLLSSADGTCTLYSQEFEESYHSTRDGALHESLYKHVKPAIKLTQHKEKLTILDICFGLGYNSFATLYWVQKLGLKTKIHILSPELDEGLVRTLQTFQYPAEFDALKEIIDTVSTDFFYEDEQFKIEVLIGDAREIIEGLAPKNKLDIIYQDAFSPRKNPMLWTKEWFSDIRKICADDAVLTTYSVASAVRLGLHENGFHIYLNQLENMRDATIASPSALKGYKTVDMELKKLRNPQGKSLRDRDYERYSKIELI